MKYPRRIDYKARRIALRKVFDTEDEEQEIIRLYIHEKRSAIEISDIIERLGVKITPRSIQRILKKHGVSRSIGDAFRLAAKRGRVKWAYKSPLLKVRRRKLSQKLRFSVLSRDGFQCVLCGKNAESAVLEVDHITPLSKNGSDDYDNLRTLCHDCNAGKRIVFREY